MAKKTFTVLVTIEEWQDLPPVSEDNIERVVSAALNTSAVVQHAYASVLPGDVCKEPHQHLYGVQLRKQLEQTKQLHADLRLGVRVVNASNTR